MQIDPALLKLQLIEALSQLEQNLDDLVNLIYQEQAPLWVWDPEKKLDTEAKQRQHLCQIIAQLNYQDGQDKSKTLLCPALLLASENTGDKIEQVNQAKDELKQVFLAMEGQTTFDKKKRIPLATKVLQDSGRARFHKRQAYRHLQKVAPWPDKIGFSWGHTRRVSRISVDRAWGRLARLGEKVTNLEVQKQRLSKIPPNEALAYINYSQTKPCANLVWEKKGEGACNLVKQIQASLPLFIISTGQTELPDFRPLALDSQAVPRQQRQDRKLESQPLLPSLNIYRYLQPYRVILDTKTDDKTATMKNQSDNQ